MTGSETSLTETKSVKTPQVWPQAKAFKTPNADPNLGARLTDLNILDEKTSEYNIRIPAIAVASNGDILASYDLRPLNGAWHGGDSPNENSIVQRRSTDGGKTWGPRTTVAEGKVAGQGKRFGWSDPPTSLTTRLARSSTSTSVLLTQVCLIILPTVS